MELLNKRIYKGNDYTIGELYINGVFFSHTLEDKVRLLNSYEDKVYGQTAIPIGRYKVIISYSNHFKKEMPEILNVEFFKGIRIHAGNDNNDTDGCILVGECRNVEEGWIYNSKNTYNKLFNILKAAFNNNEEIFINIQ
jgi:hypothetical protein